MRFQYKHIFIVKIAVITLLALAAAWFLVNKLYFSTSLMLLILVVTAISVYHDRKKLLNRVEHLILSIQHGDFSTHFAKESKDAELNRLSTEMNSALLVFQQRNNETIMGEAEAKAWQKLISVLTHEIMNSIAPIISLSETLSEQQDSPTLGKDDYLIMQQAMNTIHRRSKGLLSFVDNYRKLTRLPQPQIYPFYVKELLQSLQQLLAPAGVHFSYTLHPKQLLLKADKGMVEQMLINLLKNAREACQDQDNVKIDVRAEKVGDEIRISVSDNGQGIIPEAMEKVFIPFYSTKSNGSGIGLSVCQQIIIRHKGRITAHSDSKGTRFTMEFPQ